MPENSSPTSWVDLFTDFGNLSRLLIFLAALAILFLLMAYVLVTYLNPESIRLDTAGTVTISGIGRPTQYLVLLPSSQCWMKTTISLKQGQRAHILSSGRVHLAVGSLVQATDKGQRTIHHTWLGPEGDTSPRVARLDIQRRQMLVAPGEPIGSVLAYVGSGKDDPASNCTNARPPGIVSVKADGSIEGEGTLWLTMNDMIIDPKDEANKKEYMSTPEVLREAGYIDEKGNGYSPEYYGKRWERFKSDGQFDAFFQDNVGSFLVQITVEKK
jgi:hypothetical protein